MNTIISYRINSSVEQYNYLKTHSYWYKYLNRNSNNYKFFLEEMKKEYKITMEDRVSKVAEKIDDLSKIIDILN